MSYLFIFLISFFIVKFFFFAKKYEYKVTVIAGKTGSGKTMLATSIALDYLKNDIPVFSTYYIEGANILPFDFYNYNFPENSLLIIDEAQIGLDSREYKNLSRSGISSLLKAKLSMHRHQKLDIIFITQNVEEIDAQIRRYCSELFFCSHTFLRRKITKNGFVILPYIQTFEVWPDILTYEQYKKRIDPRISIRDYGVVKRFKIITHKVFNKYNTYQNDKTSYNLKDIDVVLHNDINSLIDTGIIKK